MKISELIRYGEIVADDELYSMCSEYADNVRITIVKYGGNVFYTKRINGEDEYVQVIGYEE